MKEGEGEVGRRNPNFPPRPPLPALRNKFNFVGRGNVRRRRLHRCFLSFAHIGIWKRRNGERTLPDGENRALNHDQSASKLRRLHLRRGCSVNYEQPDQQSGKPFPAIPAVFLHCSPRQQSRRNPPGQPATRLTNHPPTRALVSHSRQHISCSEECLL